MTNVIILGDIHLGKSVSIGKAGVGMTLNSRIEDQLNLLDWTLDQAIEYQADHIIITGDVFEDPKPHPALIAFFMAWLKKCQVHNIYVIIIVGNHDVLRSGFVYTSPLDIISEADLENVTIYKEINTVIIGTSAFTLVPYRDRKSFSAASNAEGVALVRDSLVYELASIPTTYHKVLIGHLAIEGSIPIGDEIDDLANELFCPIEMFQGYDFVWMGHVHKPQVMNKSNPYVAHIGSMDISNFGETDHKKHIIIYRCDGEVEWESKNLPTRPLQKISVAIPKDVEDTTQFVLDEIEKIGVSDRAIVRVEVSLAAPELKSVSKASIEKYLVAHGAFNVTGISESKKVSVVKKDTNNTIDTKMDVVSAIKTYAQTYIDDSMKDAFTQLAIDFYNAYKAEGKE